MLSNLFLIKDGSWEFEYPIGKSGTYYIVVTCMYNGIWTVNIAHYGDFN
jgi:hypothetical protein